MGEVALKMGCECAFYETTQARTRTRLESRQGRDTHIGPWRSKRHTFDNCNGSLRRFTIWNSVPRWHWHWQLHPPIPGDMKDPCDSCTKRTGPPPIHSVAVRFIHIVQRVVHCDWTSRGSQRCLAGRCAWPCLIGCGDDTMGCVWLSCPRASSEDPFASARSLCSGECATQASLRGRVPLCS
jgi:hypothetical protein